MTRFEELTSRGQRGRLRKVALTALGAYGFETRHCSFLTQSYNTLFRVAAADGALYALRVSPDQLIQMDGIEDVEAAWLTALADETDLSVVRIRRTREGAVMARASASGVPGVRRCTLFDWLPGRTVDERISGELMERAGRLSAGIHEHAAAHATRAPAPVLVADRVIYWKLPKMLGTLAGYGSLFAEAMDRVDGLIADLWRDPPHAPHLLHGDVTPNNLVAFRGDVTLIDFQDLIWGFEIQDLAITLSSLWLFDGRDELAAAFRSGYEQVRGWPGEDPAVLEALIVARRLDMLNYALYLRRPDVDAHSLSVAELVRRWMTAAGTGGPAGR